VVLTIENFLQVPACILHHMEGSRNAYIHNYKCVHERVDGRIASAKTGVWTTPLIYGLPLRWLKEDFFTGYTYHTDKHIDTFICGTEILGVI
jgi:hypothetical protein